MVEDQGFKFPLESMSGFTGVKVKLMNWLEVFPGLPVIARGFLAHFGDCGINWNPERQSRVA